MIKKITITLTALVLAAGCTQQTEPTETTAERSLQIYTTIAPIYFVAHRLLGDNDTIINTTPPGEDGAHHIPERDVLMEMANADLIILNGAGFEEWVDAVSLPDSILFDSAQTFREEWIPYETLVHSHGGHDDHSHEGYNGHTWIAPSFFQKQVTAIYEKLKTMLTEEEQEARNLSENYLGLYAELTALDAKGRAMFAPLRGTTLAATHPTYDYLARAYGFKIFNVDIDPDAAEITTHIDGELHKLDHLLEHTPITFLLWEEEPSKVLQEAVADRNLTNIVFSPLEDMDDPDYITGMENTFREIAEILTDE